MNTHKHIELALAVAFPILFTMLLTLVVFNFPCVLTCHINAGKHSCHSICADMEAGRVYTPEQLEILESFVPEPGLGTKTPPPAGILLDSAGNNEITVVVDFKSSNDPVPFAEDVIGNTVGPIETDAFGFTSQEFDGVKAAIMAELQEDYFHELAGFVSDQYGPNMQLKLNIIEGEIGTPPPGVAEYYFVQVGTVISGPCAPFLGCAIGSAIRDENGNRRQNIENGDVVASTFTNNIVRIGSLSPSNALTSGNVEFTTNAIVGTLSHEIGHSLSLSHINTMDSIQPTMGVAPIMGTGAIDLPNQRRLEDREFSIFGFNDQAGGDSVFQINQLVGAIGLEKIGDFDVDGDVDGDDVDFYIGNLNQPATGNLAQLDLDGDGQVTLADHNLHVTTLVVTSNGVTGALLGDVNLDGTVDVLGDAFALIGSLGLSVTSRSQGDLNADGMVDVLGDAFILVGQLGQSNDP